MHETVKRLVDQMTYAYQHGGGHAGHLSNALHTAKALSNHIQDLTEQLVQARQAIARYEEQSKIGKWSCEL